MCMSGVKQSVLSVVVAVVVCRYLKNIFIKGDLESITTSKREDNNEIRRILALVYLIEHKAVLFSAFSTFF